MAKRGTGPAAGPVVARDRSDSRRSPLQRLAAPLYLACLLLVVLPIVDLVTNVWPLRPWEVGWRYGAVGLGSGFLLTPFLGIIAGLALARSLLQRRMLLFVSWAAGITALLLVGAAMLFALDALQVAEQIPEQGWSAFQVGAVRAVVKLILVAGALGWLSVAGLRGGRGS